MKFSVALSLCLAPVVLAKSIRNSYPARRDYRNANSNSHNSDKNNGNNGNSGKGSSNNAGALAAAEAALVAEAAQAGLILGSLSQIIVIWVNGGGGAATTTINSVQTVTQTVTAGGAAAATAAAAATTAAAASGTTAASGAGATHTVTVGGPKGLVYEPSSIEAAVGDMVIFTFLSQNHTVSQSAFATPCELLAGGMDSGFQPNINNTVNPPPQVALQVMVATPLWFYCRQKGHCGKGMVFSINPTANKTQALFQQMAIAQNGTGTGSAITGGTTSAAAVVGTTAAGAAAAAETATSSTAPAAAAASAAAGSSSSGTDSTSGSSGSASGSSGSSSGSSGSASSSSGSSSGSSGSSGSTGSTSGSTDSTPGTGLTTGTGTVNSDGSCSCAVLCNSNAFPAVQAQGIGAFGGFGGSVPMSALPALSAR